jgi:hypothetical protein
VKTSNEGALRRLRQMKRREFYESYERNPRAALAKLRDESQDPIVKNLYADLIEVENELERVQAEEFLQLATYGPSFGERFQWSMSNLRSLIGKDTEAFLWLLCVMVLFNTFGLLANLLVVVAIILSYVVIAITNDHTRYEQFDSGIKFTVKSGLILVWSGLVVTTMFFGTVITTTPFNYDYSGYLLKRGAVTEVHSFPHSQVLGAHSMGVRRLILDDFDWVEHTPSEVTLSYVTTQAQEIQLDNDQRLRYRTIVSYVLDGTTPETSYVVQTSDVNDEQNLLKSKIDEAIRQVTPETLGRLPTADDFTRVISGFRSPIFSPRVLDINISEPTVEVLIEGKWNTVTPIPEATP